MNRRSFITGILAACAAPMWLKGAGRIWKPSKPIWEINWVQLDPLPALPPVLPAYWNVVTLAELNQMQENTCTIWQVMVNPKKLNLTSTKET